MNLISATSARQADMEDKDVKATKNDSKFKRFMRAVFVNNAWYKLFAIGFGVLLWLLVVGFNL